MQKVAPSWMYSFIETLPVNLFKLINKQKYGLLKGASCVPTLRPSSGWIYVCARQDDHVMGKYFLTRWSILCLFMLFSYVRCFAADQEHSEVFGQAWDCRRGALITPASDLYNDRPLTVECRVKLLGQQEYNILVAHETKNSADHWEIFTTPGDGILHIYLPGTTPDHLHSSEAIADGKWHWVAMVLAADRVSLFVDGQEKASQVFAKVEGSSISGPLSLGGLVEGGFGCNGLLDEVRISADALFPVTGTDSELPVSPETLALWRFPVENPAADASGRGMDGQVRPTNRIYTPEGIQIPGGMPTALQSLPPQEDASPLRDLLSGAILRLRLRSVRSSDISDAVLRQWNHDFDWMGKKEYPESRPGEPDRAKVEREVYDRNALVLEEDKGPLGTVIRRTGALFERLKESNPGVHPEIANDLDFLKAVMMSGDVVPGSEPSKALYLAACAVRRKLALANPVLDFDSIVCVVRGTFEGSVRSNPQTADPQGGHFVTQYFGFNALPGGGLYIIRNYKDRPEVIDVLSNAVVANGRLKGRKLDYGAFATPDLSYDGKTIVFAWTENKEHKWIYSKSTCFHVFKVNVDGSNLVQLTDGDTNDFDPCWLPDGRIAFVSERRGGYIRCFL